MHTRGPALILYTINRTSFELRSSTEYKHASYGKENCLGRRGRESQLKYQKIIAHLHNREFCTAHYSGYIKLNGSVTFTS